VNSSRLRSIVMIAVFDIAGPLVACSLLRSAGLSTVTALVLSGVFPAAGVLIVIVQHRRVDAVGLLRHVFRVMTMVWGAAYLAEAARLNSTRSGLLHPPG
jgi:hypothetical protein